MAKQALYYLIHKPYKVLSQFSNEGENLGLGSIYDLPRDVYPVGRLDLDSEGLLILTNDKSLNNKLLNPSFRHRRTYWVEVENVPSREALTKLRNGVQIRINKKLYLTKPTEVKELREPRLPDRDPPVNVQKHPQRCWLEITLIEGKNRQVRRMTAAVGHPTLRLVRVSIEDLQLFPIKSGEITQISKKKLYQKLNLL